MKEEKIIQAFETLRDYSSDLPDGLWSKLDDQLELDQKAKELKYQASELPSDLWPKIELGLNRANGIWNMRNIIGLLTILILGIFFVFQAQQAEQPTSAQQNTEIKADDHNPQVEGRSTQSAVKESRSSSEGLEKKETSGEIRSEDVVDASRAPQPTKVKSDPNVGNSLKTGASSRPLQADAQLHIDQKTRAEVGAKHAVASQASNSVASDQYTPTGNSSNSTSNTSEEQTNKANSKIKAKLPISNQINPNKVIAQSPHLEDKHVVSNPLQVQDGAKNEQARSALDIAAANSAGNPTELNRLLLISMMEYADDFQTENKLHPTDPCAIKGNVHCSPRILGGQYAYVDFAAGAFAFSDKLRAKNDEAQALIQWIDQAESYLSAFDVQTRVGVYYEGGFTFSAGLDYKRRNTKFYYLDTDYTAEEDVNTIVVEYPNGDVFDVDERTNVDGTLTIKHTNHYNSFGIPISLGYILRRKTTAFAINAGAQFDFLFRANGKMQVGDKEVVGIKDENYDFYKNYGGASVFINANMNIQLKENWSFYFEPFYQQQVNSLTNGNAPFTSKNRNYGVNLGVRKWIRINNLK